MISGPEHRRHACILLQRQYHCSGGCWASCSCGCFGVLVQPGSPLPNRLCLAGYFLRVGTFGPHTGVVTVCTAEAAGSRRNACVVGLGFEVCCCRLAGSRYVCVLCCLPRSPVDDVSNSRSVALSAPSCFLSCCSHRDGCRGLCIAGIECHHTCTVCRICHADTAGQQCGFSTWQVCRFAPDVVLRPCRLVSSRDVCFTLAAAGRMQHLVFCWLLPCRRQNE